ncbi:hypothetical protein MCOR25_010842 [Pyricularia grisea]|nr:hypothetical protein MCOR25_010842 [Pyricularia grisea]
MAGDYWSFLVHKEPQTPTFFFFPQVGLISFYSAETAVIFETEAFEATRYRDNGCLEHALDSYCHCCLLKDISLLYFLNRGPFMLLCLKRRKGCSPSFFSLSFLLYTLTFTWNAEAWNPSISRADITESSLTSSKGLTRHIN